MWSVAHSVEPTHKGVESQGGSGKVAEQKHPRCAHATPDEHYGFVVSTFTTQALLQCCVALPASPVAQARCVEEEGLRRVHQKELVASVALQRPSKLFLRKAAHLERSPSKRDDQQLRTAVCDASVHGVSFPLCKTTQHTQQPQPPNTAHGQALFVSCVCVCVCMCVVCPHTTRS